jgi:hypothetical protein
MTGERLEWFRLASHLGLSVQRCQQETTSAEFVDWVTYLDMEPNMFHREDFYWAQIIRLLKCQLVKHPENITLDECLIKFEKRKETKREKSKSARSFFGHLLGMSKSAKTKRRP